MNESVNGIFFYFFSMKLDVLLLLAKNIFFFKKNENRAKKIQQVHFIIFYPLTVKKDEKFNTF